jgi:hypothetical protein
MKRACVRSPLLRDQGTYPPPPSPLDPPSVVEKLVAFPQRICEEYRGRTPTIQVVLLPQNNMACASRAHHPVTLICEIANWPAMYSGVATRYTR